MMGSAMAMLMGAGPSQANAGVGSEAATADETADFLAALVAAIPAATAELVAEVTPPADSASQDAEDPAAPADVSALIAGMLQALAAPAGQAAAAPESAVTVDTEPDGIAPGKPHQQAMTNLAGLLEAAARTTQQQTASAIQDATPVPQDPAAEQLAAAQGAATETATAPQPAPRADLRQLLQMLSPADRRSTTASAATVTHAGPGERSSVELPLQAAEAAVAAVSGNSPGTGLAAEPIPMARATPTAVIDLASVPSAASAATLAAQNTPAPAQGSPAPGDAGSTVHAAVGTPRWADEIGSRVMLMSLHGQHEGSLTLTPEHLGPVEVRVSVNQNTASVWFGAAHADTRAALTEALPRLRELFNDAGLMLGSADVSQQAPRQRGQGAAAGRASGAGAAPAVDGLDSHSRPAPRRVALGLVDTYV
jgi:flagellar hook-length control protein FliK